MNVTDATESYTLKRLILGYANFKAIKSHHRHVPAALPPDKGAAWPTAPSSRQLVLGCPRIPSCVLVRPVPCPRAHLRDHGVGPGEDGSATSSTWLRVGPFDSVNLFLEGRRGKGKSHFSSILLITGINKHD